jgi:hypothetical protein
LADWQKLPYCQLWEHGFVCALADKTHGQFTIGGPDRQSEILNILLQGMLATLDRQIFCHQESEECAALKILRLRLSQWFA